MFIRRSRQFFEAAGYRARGRRFGRHDGRRLPGATLVTFHCRDCRGLVPGARSFYDGEHRRRSAFARSHRQAREVSGSIRGRKVGSHAIRASLSMSPNMKGSLSADLQISRRFLAAVTDDIESHLGTVVEAAKPGSFYGRDVHKYIFAAAVGLNKSVTLLRVEPLHCTSRHDRAPF